MKKLTILLLLYVIININNIYGISDNFNFVVDTIGIPRYNVYGYEINEDIYNTYNIFVYGSPQDIVSNNMQRFRAVPNQGRWTQYSGKYIGQATRGEYYLLGTNYSGSVVSNVYFPVDAFPETSPDNWRFIDTYLAYESWYDTSKFKHNEQIEFMKSTKLLFDELDFNNKTTNPYNLIPYNISVNSVGMSKMTLDTASTWKTNGVVTARRINNQGKIRYAIFSTPKIAANANIKSSINAKDEVELKDDKIDIVINFSANAIELNEYAKDKHIKEIASVLYINNKEVSRVSGSKTAHVGKDYIMTVSRKEYDKIQTYPIDIKVRSYLYTEFSVDRIATK